MCLLVLVTEPLRRSDDYFFLYDLREKLGMHPDCDYDPGSYARNVEKRVLFSHEENHYMIEAAKKHDYLAKGRSD